MEKICAKYLVKVPCDLSSNASKERDWLPEAIGLVSFSLKKLSSHWNIINKVSQESKSMEEGSQRDTGGCFEAWRWKNILDLYLL